MGLLSRISAELPAQAVSTGTKKTGLLAKTSMLFAKPVFSSFSEFCRAYSFTHCALFSSVNGTFVITECEGFDALSAAQSVSSRDFWNGIPVSTNEFSNFSKTDSSFSAFYQFFSPDFKERLCGLHFLQISDDCVFMNVDLDSYRASTVPALSLRELLVQYRSYEKYTSERLPDISAALSHSEALLLLLSVKIAVNSAVREAGLTDQALHGAVFSAVYSQIVSLLRSRFAVPNFCLRGCNGEIKIGLFAHPDFDDSLLQFHIIQELYPVLSSCANSIVLMKAGTASSVSDIERFISEG